MIERIHIALVAASAAVTLRRRLAVRKEWRRPQK